MYGKPKWISKKKKIIEKEVKYITTDVTKKQQK
jgi:hypothetical protein